MTRMRRVRIIIGVVCLAVAAWLFIVSTSEETIVPAIANTAIGIILIATARKQ